MQGGVVCVDLALEMPKSPSLTDPSAEPSSVRNTLAALSEVVVQGKTQGRTHAAVASDTQGCCL